MDLSELWETAEGRGAWRATVHGVAELATNEWLNNNIAHLMSLNVQAFLLS